MSGFLWQGGQNALPGIDSAPPEIDFPLLKTLSNLLLKIIITIKH